MMLISAPPSSFPGGASEHLLEFSLGISASRAGRDRMFRRVAAYIANVIQVAWRVHPLQIVQSVLEELEVLGFSGHRILECPNGVLVALCPRLLDELRIHGVALRLRQRQRPSAGFLPLSSQQACQS